MRIKGTSIASFLSFLEAEYGAPRVKEFVALLDSNLKRRCEGLILASAFYPMEELEDLASRARTFFQADHRFFERSGAHNASVGLSGVHRVLLARATPLDFLKAAERSWPQFVDIGAVSADVVGDGKVRLKIEGVPSSELFCARQTGFLTRSLELAGAQGLRVSKVRCTRARDPWCEWQVGWDAELSPRPQNFTTAIRRPVAI